MKKIILGTLLFFVIFLYKPTPTLACGGSYEICCSGQGQTACNNGGGANLSCIAGHCVPGNACGNAGQACCAGNVCNSGISCISGSCGAVGVPTDILCGTGGINTAIGCLSVLNSPEGFFGQILKWAVGVGGGIAFLLIVYSGFMIMSSAGNPERLKAGQELLTSAISGLILLIFSIFILRFIGIDILGLGAFGFGRK